MVGKGLQLEESRKGRGKELERGEKQGGVTPIDSVLPPATGVKTLVKWPR